MAGSSALHDILVLGFNVGFGGWGLALILNVLGIHMCKSERGGGRGQLIFYYKEWVQDKWNCGRGRGDA